MTQPEKPNSPYIFKDLNQDLNDLYEILKRENFKNHEIRRLVDPIISKIPHDQKETDKIFISIYKTVMILLSLITMIYLLTYWDTFYWNLTALARIFLIKILPYFDWRHLKTEACLVPKFFDQSDQKTTHQSEETFNCDLCESLTTFEQFTYDLDQKIEDLIHRFIDIDRPIVVNGGIKHWIKKSPGDFIDQLTEEQGFSPSIPCKISSNIYNLRRDDVDVEKLFKHAQYFHSFFMHFQNCELEPMKIFRKHTYRPRMLPAELSPVSYNWLLWNKRHNSTNYKKIDLVDKFAVIGQIFGKTRLNLIPRKNCAKVCRNLEGVLPAEHFLVLTSLWDVEYMADGGEENIAAILEIKG